ncbi:copper chaperone PCu(A)C [Sinimarinibacterium sp. CAU 1509]|uniref:copper chaperone PCu(A)C n=1 Tax=Sinimarinibacterium sp. CAU 1509 TaxID=2562283 RepID=UPI00146E02B8|nr:copper chaperone PCu(A)C [Sinimarinibacterium sp. CAU 1509]
MNPNTFTARHSLRMLSLLLTLTLGLPAISNAESPSASSPVELTDAWVRATPPGAGAAAGYGTLRNTSDRTVRITALSSPLSKKLEIHEMKMAGGQMQMRAVADPTLAPGETLTLQPGGFHLMFMGLNSTPQAGDQVELTLELDGGSPAQFTLPVRDAAGMSHH